MSIQVVNVRVQHFPKGRWIGNAQQVYDYIEESICIVDGVRQELQGIEDDFLNSDVFVVEDTERQLINTDPDETQLVANRDFMVMEFVHQDAFEDSDLTILHNSDIDKHDIFGEEIPRLLALIPDWIKQPKPQANMYYHNNSDTNYIDLITVWEISISWGHYDEDADIDDFECKLIGHITRVSPALQVELVKAV